MCVQEFAADIAVCLDSWVGGIKMVHSKLLLQTSDGSRCIVNDPENIYVFDEKRDTVSKSRVDVKVIHYLYVYVDLFI